MSKHRRHVVRNPLGGILGDWFGLQATSAEVLAALWLSKDPLDSRSICQVMKCPTLDGLSTRIYRIRQALGPDALLCHDKQGDNHNCGRYALTPHGRSLVAEALQNAVGELRMAMGSAFDKLEEENQVLRDALGMTAVIRPEWGLSSTQQQILGIIAKRPEGVSHERLWTALYGMRDDPPIAKVINVTISHMRRKLRPYGIQINNNWGVGYWMEEESRLKVLA